jgi:hypothetical protein
VAADSPTPPRDTPEVSHERSDVRVRAILSFGAGLLITAIVIHFGLYWLLEHYNRRVSRAPTISEKRAEEPIPPPRLQVSPRTELARMRAREDQELQTYDWVDREKKIVRIPIDRAMELLAQRGLPARQGTSEKK